MCAHSSSASEIVAKISHKLYPFIADQFVGLDQYNEVKDAVLGSPLLTETVLNLKHEFESLRNYETKLVFPSVQKVFDTKNNPDFKSTVDVNQLQQLTQNKELLIKNLVKDLKMELDTLNLAKGHPVHLIINVFNDFFFVEKEKWNRMLTSFNKSCACFALANEKHSMQEKTSQHH